MKFEEDTAKFETGKKFGFLVAYLFFTTVLFVLLTLLNRFPADWTFFHAAGITLVISIVGIGFRKVLK